MTTFQKLKHEARRAEQRSDWRKAIQLYREALRFDERRGGHEELGLFNRIGDLHIRIGEVNQAVECYEIAADRYAESQLSTSAVALCNKILRVAPDRTDVFRRLALLHATTGLIAEARSSLLQYVDRLQAEGKLSEALEGVQELVDATDDESIRLTIADLLSERGHRAQAAAQIRLAAASARRRGEDVSELETRLRDLGEPVESKLAPKEDSASEVESDPTVPSPDSSSAPESEESRIRLADQLSAALGAGAERVRGFAPGAGRADRGDLAEIDELVLSELEEFRDGIGAALGRGGPSLHYDLGVAFQAMGLDAAAVEELRVGMADPSCVRRGAERIVSIVEPSPVMVRDPSAGPGQREELHPPTVTSEAIEDPRRAIPPAGEPGSPGMASEPDVPPDLAVNASEEVSGISTDPDPTIEAPAGPDGEESLEPDLQALFFRARLAQYQIREAEDAGRTDYRAHLDLGSAYAEMGLTVEAVRELTTAGSGDGHVAARAASMLLALARDENTVAGELEDLAGRARERKLTPDEMEEAPTPREAGESLPGPAPDVSTGAVVLEERTPVEAAASLRAEAEELVAAAQEEEAMVRLFRALALLEDARELREAIRIVDFLLTLRPDDVVLHHQRAEFALGLNDRSLLVDSYLALASSLRRQQAPESARTVYARILDIEPDHPVARQAAEALAERPFAPARDGVDRGRLQADGDVGGGDRGTGTGRGRP
ncbi:MAG: hypothetical protein P8049_06915 [Gemmatimonadota bacterium]